jgi:hypothetical protein
MSRCFQATGKLTSQLAQPHHEALRVGGIRRAQVPERAVGQHVVEHEVRVRHEVHRDGHVVEPTRSERYKPNWESKLEHFRFQDETWRFQAMGFNWIQLNSTGFNCIQLDSAMRFSWIQL